jgi:hypothetical protein
MTTNIMNTFFVLKMETSISSMRGTELNRPSQRILFPLKCEGLTLELLQHFTTTYFYAHRSFWAFSDSKAPHKHGTEWTQGTRATVITGQSCKEAAPKASLLVPHIEALCNWSSGMSSVLNYIHLELRPMTNMGRILELENLTFLVIDI